MFLGSCHRVRTWNWWIAMVKMRTVSNIVLKYVPSCEPMNLLSPVLGCLRCATGRSSDAHQARWWSWPLWLTGQSNLELLWACGTSMSVWSVSTSPCRSESWTGSQTQTRRSRRLCPCWWRKSRWNPLRWTRRNLMRDKREFKISPLLLCVHVFAERSLCVCYVPTAMPGSQLTVCTSSLPWCRTTQLGSIWDVPLGSRGTIWNLRKSVSLMAKFSGHTS